MKVIILAGGFGTRISEHTQKIPKPMVMIGRNPIIWHIMNHYNHFGFEDFLLALGYKAEIIKDYFLNYHKINSNFKIDLSSGKIERGDKILIIAFGAGLTWGATVLEW